MIAYLAAYVALSTTGLLLLRARLDGAMISELPRDIWFLVGAACYIGSFVTWLVTLRHFPVTRAFPLFLGTTYAAVTVGAVAILGEHLTAPRLAGVALVGVGVVLLAR